MSRNRNDLVRGRKNRIARPLRLGGYLILTDTSETESNYFKSIRDGIPVDIQCDLQMKIYSDNRTEEIIQEAQRLRNSYPTFREVWVIFDRDYVTKFDQMVQEIERDGMHAGWSNPCFEIWLSAYFGEMPVLSSPQKCTERFALLLKHNAGIKEYDKADVKLRNKLLRYGSEEKAISYAARKHKAACSNYIKPSEMIGCTTVYQLVKELLEKTI